MPLAVLGRLHPVPATFLKQLATDGELFWQLPIGVQRQVGWLRGGGGEKGGYGLIIWLSEWMQVVRVGFRLGLGLGEMII